MTKVYRTLQYRQCRWAPTGPTLFDALSSALNRKGTIGRRKQITDSRDDDHPTCLVINLHIASGHGMAGSIIEWTEGQGQPFLEGVDDDLAQMDVLLEPGKLKFISGISYFFVRGNHVVLAPSRAIAAGRIEQHWQWLCGHRGEQEHASAFSLLEVPPNTERVEAMLQNVRTVTVNPAPAIIQGPAGGERKDRTVTANVKSMALVRRFVDWLSEFGPDGLEPAQLKQALSSPNIRASISISYAGQLPADGAPMLDTLAHHVSQLHEDASVGYTIESKLGDLTSDQLRLRNRVRIEATEGHPNRVELWTYMSDWLAGLIETRTVRENV